MRGFLKLALLSALGAAGTIGTPAQAASGSIWDHNGSKMTLEEKGEKRKLIYSEPREGLDKAGIKVGTVLFNGERKADGRLAGFARIYKGNCNPVDYFVEGTLNEARGEIVLQGQAPVYASGTSCEVTGYSDTSAASTLKFAKISDAPDSPAVASRTPEPEIEQGDRGPADEYLPPAQPGRSASRPQEDLPPLTPRNQPGERAEPGQAPAAPDARNRATETDPEDQEELGEPAPRRYGRDDSYDDRRYSRAPDPYAERRPRRPGIWNPEEETPSDDDEGYYDDYDRPPPSPFWGRRPW